jgi:GntR family transcriptional regulator/MocR family aminotransferase
MVKRPLGHSIPLLRDPRDAPGSALHRQLYQRIRDGVLEGAIPPGTRLPAARTLAREEGISRNTVEAALGRLQAEGFVVRHVGAGTWISDRIPARLVPSRTADASYDTCGSAAAPPAQPLLSGRGRRVAEANPDPGEPPGLLFTPSGPGLEDLPLSTWNRVTRRRTRERTGELLAAPPPGGLPALREAVAAYLHLDRGVRGTAERVVIVNSTQQAIDLAARLLLDPGDAVWLEDPGYVAARRAFIAAGARTVAVPVDGEGIDVAAGAALAADARLAYVTPSHQYPLGVTLSLARRLELLAWAKDAEAWILEDDYDSELRYDGRPLASMQGIDESGRVIYVGTFNKILFPAVRAAYLVLPKGLVEPFIRAKALADGFTSPFVQAVLGDFLGEGHFSAHLRRVRELYRERRDAFVKAAARHLPPHAVLGPAEAGVHVAVHLPEGSDDRRLSERARRDGLALPALSAHSIESAARGLLVHFGHVPAAELDSAMRRLAGVLKRERRDPRG